MESLTVQLNNILGEYEQEIDETSQKVFQKTAREAVKQLRATSPKQQGGKRSGSYAKGWTTKKEGSTVVVHNKTDYQLTHLLENGHALRQGGRARAIPHIKPVEEWANREVVEELEREL